MVGSALDNQLDEVESAVAVAAVIVMFVIVLRRCDVGFLAVVVVVILQVTVLRWLKPLSMYVTLSGAGSAEGCLL